MLRVYVIAPYGATGSQGKWEARARWEPASAERVANEWRTLGRTHVEALDDLRGILARRGFAKSDLDMIRHEVDGTAEDRTFKVGFAHWDFEMEAPGG